MALDVHLTREGAEPWGFELVGGADEEMPLTVQQIQAQSPAKRAGLQNGDTILMMNGVEAIDFTRKEARRMMETAGSDVVFGVVRGLYDPVLDDSEPIYEYPPDDLDPRLQPTEVSPKTPQFIEPPDLTDTLLDIPIPDYTPSFIPETGSRSLTASPFVTPTKPYRPFSTEPLPDVLVPPLENPIILNPNYADQFGKSPADEDPDYLLNAHYKNSLGECGGGFKLPISEQYDPDGTRRVKNVEIEEKVSKYEKQLKSLKDLEVVDRVIRTVEVDENVSKRNEKSLFVDAKSKEILTNDVKLTDISKETTKISSETNIATVQHDTSTKTETRELKTEEQSIKEELMYIEKMKQDIDIKKIEETALSIVEDSIERAVSIAEEIKKEMDEELVSISTEQKDETITQSSEIKDSTLTTKDSTTFNESETVLKDSKKSKTSTEIENETYATEVTHEKRMDTSEKEERVSKESIIESSDVSAIEKSELTSHQYAERDFTDKSIRKESVAHESKSYEGGYTKVTETIANGSVKTDGNTDQKFIGLKTIPNIRGVVHSNYYYNLLLQTFFIHLTDVMVALSRFLLTQPIFNETLKSQETTMKSEVHKTTKDMKHNEKAIRESVRVEKQRATADVKVVEEKKKEIVKPVVQEKKVVKETAQKIEDKKIDTVQAMKVQTKEMIKPIPLRATIQEVHTEAVIKEEMQKTEQKTEVKDSIETSEKKIVTGAEMAQRTEKKLTKEMTQKLDAVISEFQSVAVEDDKNEMMQLQRSRRSRSRSHVEEEVMKESDPLLWLDKVEMKTSQQICEKSTETSKTEIKEQFSSSETTQKSFVETKSETKHKKTKTPKQMYVAIVESHVFTNKDAIFEEEVSEFSETSSVQSADEVNTAFEAIETITTENVALENAIKQLENAQIEVEQTHDFSTVTSKSKATVQKYEEKTHDTKEIIKENYKRESAIESRNVQETIVQETKEIIEPVIEIKQDIKTEKVAVDVSESLSIAENSEVSIQESKEELKSIDIGVKHEKVAIDLSESLSIAENTEVNIQESKQELKTIDIKEESVAIVEQEKVKETAIVEQEKVKETEIVEKVEVQAAVLEIKPPEDVNVSALIKLKQDKPVKTLQNEYAELNIIKEFDLGTKTNETIEIEDVTDVNISLKSVKMGSQKETDISGHKDTSFTSSLTSKQSSIKQELDITQQTKSETITKGILKGYSSTAKTSNKKLTLKTDLERQISGPPSTIDTPTPSTVPPTPLTDEYVFKLQMPLPKSRSSTPVPRDCSLTPEDEDPHIVKKKLIPHIDIEIESRIFDPPLPTPEGDKPQSPVYTKPGLSGGAQKYPNFLTRLGKIAGPVYKKPGLFGGAPEIDVRLFNFPTKKHKSVYRKPGLYGGADKPDMSEEEIREIERKSSLLASAIDETIKSIEEYKEEVGIDTKKETQLTEFKEVKTQKEVTITTVKNGVTTTQNEIEKSFKTYNEISNNKNGHSITIEELNPTENDYRHKEIVGTKKSVDCKEESEATSREDTEERERADTESETVLVEYKDKANSKETQLQNTIHVETNKSTLENSHELPPSASEKEIEKEEVENNIQVDAEQRNERITNLNEKIESSRNGIETGDVKMVTETERKEKDTVEDVKRVDTITNDLKTEMNGKVQSVRDDKEIEGDVKRVEEEKVDPMKGYRPVVFDPDSIPKRSAFPVFQESAATQGVTMYKTASGEVMGTHQGIVDSLDESTVDDEVAKEMGKPGMTEEKIAELISGEAEMLREAHVMGLSRVLTSHMHRPDDSVDFQKIKPIISSLKDSEVLKALNEEVEAVAKKRAEERKKKEHKHWTTFLQKPSRPVPRAKFGYHGYIDAEETVIAEPYKVNIVKQPKPKVAPDYHPEDFDTGPLPWEERSQQEANQPPVEPEEPILIPEQPVFLEAVDPLKESEVPDLEDTGIPLPPPKEPTPPLEEQVTLNSVPEDPEAEEEVEVQEEKQNQEEEKRESREEMENKIANQLVKSVQGMVDPNATVEQQLSQMRAQLAALAQLPEVIQQTLELVTKQLNQMGQTGAHVEMSASHTESHSYQEMEVTQNDVTAETEITSNHVTESETDQKPETPDSGHVTIEEMQENNTQESQMQEMHMQETQMQEKVTQERTQMLKTPELTEEDRKMEKQKKEQRQESEARQLKQRGTPRSTKPKKVFGPLDPEERMAVVLPGGRRWKGPKDVYDEQQFAETMQAQAELIQGKALGFESDKLPFDERVNFMKYEKPPVTLDHLKHSEVYKLVHDMDQPPLKRVEMRSPVIAEADYRERCRSSTPSMMNKHGNIPQQFHP